MGQIFGKDHTYVGVLFLCFCVNFHMDISELGWALPASVICKLFDVKTEFTSCFDVKVDFTSCFDVKTDFRSCFDVKADFTSCFDVKTDFTRCFEGLAQRRSCCCRQVVWRHLSNLNRFARNCGTTLKKEIKSGMLVLAKSFRRRYSW